MDIQIKRLTPELVNDYMNYFDHVAFTDNEEWAGCYCVFYHWNDKLEAECKECTSSGGVDFRRNLALKMILEGKLQGYLAYTDGEVVGWCNANDKNNFERLDSTNRPELWEEVNSDDKVKSIVCYSVAPHMRHKGLATKLLEKVCEDAVKDGYTYVEAYPWKNSDNIQRNYHGPLELYQKFSFSEIKELDHEYVVRKYVQ